MFAAAEMTFVFAGMDGVDAPGGPSALRFLESFDIGLISCADKVSVFE